jgi:hypothetical protein
LLIDSLLISCRRAAYQIKARNSRWELHAPANTVDDWQQRANKKSSPQVGQTTIVLEAELTKTGAEARSKHSASALSTHQIKI